MACGPGRDVVLLNADTRVPDGWLDRLRAAARAEPGTGTVTPLSNNGELASLGGPHRPVPMPGPGRLAALDDAARAANAGLTVALPTGVGFCLYIRRACLDAVGPLDAETFGRGYGEEADFCMRAARLGWRHVCAADLVVAHRGAVSFGAERAGLVARNMPRVARRHPEYRPLVARFVAEDPLAPARRAIARAVPERRGPSPVLAVAEAPAAESAAREPARRAAAAAGRPLLWLSPLPGTGGAAVRLESEDGGGAGPLSYRLPDEAAELAADIRRLGPGALHFAGLGQPAPLLEALAPLDLATSVAVTDAASRQAALAAAGGGEPRLRRILARARRIFAPDGESVAALRPVFGDRVAPLAAAPLPPPPPPTGRTTPGAVAVAAGAEPPAGAAALLALARAAAAGGQGLRFFVFGETPMDTALRRSGAADVLGPVPPGDRGALARSLGCRVALALLPPGALLPEAAAPAAGLCPKLAVLGEGPAAEAARGRGGAVVIPPDAPPAEAVTRLRELAA
jgi:hypothetical protein